MNVNLSNPDKSQYYSTRLLQRPQTIILIKWAQNFWLMSFFVLSPLIPWDNLQENHTQMHWLVQDIQMFWYNWCKIQTLKWRSDWCEQQHPNLNMECFFFSEKKNQKWWTYAFCFIIKKMVTEHYNYRKR